MHLKSEEFDPLAYIESAFLDREEEVRENRRAKAGPVFVEDGAPLGLDEGPKVKFRRTEMRAPRPRRANSKKPETQVIDPGLQEVWENLPRNIEFLMSYFDDSVTANYYRGEFRESRHELIKRLLDPELSLEETSRLLGVCPATVRRYTNRGWLKHHRTTGGQRRFRLSDIGAFVAEHGRFPEE
jgi:excisionase family DNA binding protein